MRTTGIIGLHTRSETAMRIAAKDHRAATEVSANVHLARPLWREMVAARPAPGIGLVLVRGSTYVLSRDDLSYLLKVEKRASILTQALPKFTAPIDDDLLDQILTQAHKRARSSVLDTLFAYVGERTDNLSADAMKKAAAVSSGAMASCLVRHCAAGELDAFLSNAPSEQTQPRLVKEAIVRLIAERRDLIGAAATSTNSVVREVAACSRHLTDPVVQQALAETECRSANRSKQVLNALAMNMALHPQTATWLVQNWPDLQNTLPEEHSLLTAAGWAEQKLTGPLEAEPDTTLLGLYAQRHVGFSGHLSIINRRAGGNIDKGNIPRMAQNFDAIALLANPNLTREHVAQLLKTGPRLDQRQWWHRGQWAYQPYIDAAEKCARRFPDLRDQLLPEPLSEPVVRRDSIRSDTTASADVRLRRMNAQNLTRAQLKQQVAVLDDHLGEQEQPWRIALEMANGFVGTPVELARIATDLASGK